MSIKYSQKAIELFIIHDEKHQRTLSIIEALVKGDDPLTIAKAHGITRRAVSDIRTKYVKPESN